MFNGEKVSLRALELSDLDTIMKYWNNLKLRNFLGSALPQSRLEVEEWIKNSWQLKKEGKRYFFAFEDIKTKELLGVVNFTMNNPINQSAEMGIWIYSENNWDKGYGTDATKVMIKFGFNFLNLHRIELSVYPLNERAISIYKKLGFSVIGRKRESRYMNGEFRDEILMDILKAEWEKRQVNNK